jgi:hypothetical protein
MKNIRVILLAFAVTVALFSVVVFTACNKTTCNGVVCQNGGTCANGNCQCPTGYSGALCQLKASTAISYKNNTFTPITIAVNGATATIPVGGSVAFAGQVGTVATGTASTSGTANELGISTANGIIGLTISWDINNTFPSSDTLRVPLDVGATYFFLRIKNTYSKNIIDFYVNVNFTYGQVYQDVTIPNDGNTYDMGYYLAYSSSNVQTQSSDNKVVWKAVTLPFTSNQAYTVNIP